MQGLGVLFISSGTLAEVVDKHDPQILELNADMAAKAEEIWSVYIVERNKFCGKLG